MKVPKLDPSPDGRKPQFLLLASYCGPDDDTGCTEKTPCALCLSVCNVFDEDGNYVRELGSAQRKRKRRLRNIAKI